MRGVIRAGHGRAAEGQRLLLRAVAEPRRVGARPPGRRRRPDSSLYLTTGLGLQQGAAVQGRRRCRLSRFTAATARRPLRRGPERRTPLSTGGADAARRSSSSRAADCSSCSATTRRSSGDWPLHAGSARRAGRSHRHCAAARSARSTTAIRSSSSSRIRGTATSPTCGSSAIAARRRARRPRARPVRRRRDGARRSAASGSGRVIAFTSTLDADWNDFPRHGDVPAAAPRDGQVPRAVRRPRGLAHRRPHARHLGAGRVDRARRAGQATLPGAATSGVVVSPSGQQIDARRRGRAVDRARRAGVLLGATPGHGRPAALRGGRQPRSGRVRSDVAPADRVSGGRDRHRPRSAAAGQSLEQPGRSHRPISRRSSPSGGSCSWPAWSLLLVEAVLSNRPVARSWDLKT